MGQPPHVQMNLLWCVAIPDQNRVCLCPSVHQVSALQWSGPLAAQAAAWAKTCPARSSRTPGVGENMAWAYPELSQAVQAWYDTSANYSYAAPQFSSDTGFFTQLVWRDTQRMGCAKYTACKYASFVCQFDPPGGCGPCAFWCTMPWVPYPGVGECPGLFWRGGCCIACRCCVMLQAAVLVWICWMMVARPPRLELAHLVLAACIALPLLQATSLARTGQRKCGPLPPWAPFCRPPRRHPRR